MYNYVGASAKLVFSARTSALMLYKVHTILLKPLCQHVFLVFQFRPRLIEYLLERRS